MQLLRKLLGWNFALFAVVSILNGCWLLIEPIHGRGASLPIPLLAVEVAFFVVAWWMIWKGKPSARIWGGAGSLMLILDSLYFYIRTSRSLWGMLMLGSVGVAAFL
ncbi:MAG: hypothetical protein WBX19_02980 [Terracidiphilus sp.]